jgi:hypothetical protein
MTEPNSLANCDGTRPDLFKPQHSTYKERELYLDTKDQDRVKRAWEFVYSHGCRLKSPF